MTVVDLANPSDCLSLTICVLVHCQQCCIETVSTRGQKCLGNQLAQLSSNNLEQFWHAALWANTKKYKISTNLIQVIKNLYNKATSAILFNSSTGDWFRTTVGVRQGCLLSPTLVNIFLERIMTDALEDHEGTVSIGSRLNTILRFADDIDGLAGVEELAYFGEHLDKASTAYGMEISAEKTKLMTNNTKVNGQKLETVTSFKYLDSVITDEGPKPEILSRIAQTSSIDKAETSLD